MPRKVWMVVGGVVLLVVLAGAAFVGARLLGQKSQSVGPGGGGAMLVTKDGKGGGFNVRLQVKPAPELPQTPVEAKGIFVRRDDRSIFIGTGQVTMMVKKDTSGQANASANYDGPVAEVVVSPDTQVYRDTTKLPDNPPSGDVTLQQTVEPGSLDEIGPNSMLTVWGNRSGDRIVAQTLVYSQPAILTKPGG
jgi:hypothetical protein